MTKSRALRIVRETSDDDTVEDEELEALFSALYDREPDDEDRENGLWSLVCAATTPHTGA